MRIDPDVLRDAAEILDRELRGLTGDAMGTPNSLRAEATMPPEGNWFGRWDTAAEMEHGYRTARDVLLFYYDELLRQVAGAIEQLRTSAAEHERDDEAGQASFAAQDEALAGSDPPTNTGPVTTA